MVGYPKIIQNWLSSVGKINGLGYPYFGKPPFLNHPLCHTFRHASKKEQFRRLFPPSNASRDSYRYSYRCCIRICTIVLSMTMICIYLLIYVFIHVVYSNGQILRTSCFHFFQPLTQNIKGHYTQTMGKCSKGELRTSRGHILRTSPLIFACLEHKNKPYTQNKGFMRMSPKRDWMQFWLGKHIYIIQYDVST